MKIIIVTATNIEAQPFKKILSAPFYQLFAGRLTRYTFNDDELDILVTGIGNTLTTFWLTRVLEYYSYDLVINAGIAGAYHSELPKRSVVQVTEEQFADLGYKDPQQYMTAFEMGLIGPDTFPFEKGKLINPHTDKKPFAQELQGAKGVTVQMIYHAREYLQAIRDKFNPDIETMESAAVFYVCLVNQVPFVAIRGISNNIEETDKRHWDIPGALEQLSDFIINRIKTLYS